MEQRVEDIKFNIRYHSVLYAQVAKPAQHLVIWYANFSVFIDRIRN